MAADDFESNPDVRYILGLSADDSILFSPKLDELHPENATNRLALGYEAQSGVRYFYNAVPMSMQETQQHVVRASQRLSPFQKKNAQNLAAHWRQTKTQEHALRESDIPPEQKEQWGRVLRRNGEDIKRRGKDPRPRRTDVAAAWKQWVNEQQDIIGFVAVPQIRSENGYKVQRLTGPFPVRAKDYAVLDPYRLDHGVSRQGEPEYRSMTTLFHEHGVPFQNGVQSGI